ncbi:MAG: hypothetical protein CL831_09590, partial [Crocinitomicaceae bacterium]|nr:hypothetical protein [Crocinitomicaceae bacterium]
MKIHFISKGFFGTHKPVLKIKSYQIVLFLEKSPSKNENIIILTGVELNTAPKIATVISVLVLQGLSPCLGGHTLI